MDSIKQIPFCEKYARSGIGPRRGIEVQCQFRTPSAIDATSSCIALLVEEHNLDWTDHDSPHSSSNAEAIALGRMVFGELKHLTDEREVQTESAVRDGLLTAYQRANDWAENSGITASLLTIILRDHVAYVASVGACKSYQLSDGKMSEMSSDDHARMEIDGESHVNSNCLLNVIGMGRVDSLSEIHFNRYQIKSEDILLLCSGAFHQNVSEYEVLQAALLHSDLHALCDYLAEMSTKRVRALDSLSFCILPCQRVRRQQILRPACSPGPTV